MPENTEVDERRFNSVQKISHEIYLFTGSDLISSSDCEFLSSTDLSEEDMSERDIRKRTDLELAVPILGPDSASRGKRHVAHGCM